MNATICPTCGVRERSYDGESATYFTYCVPCFRLYTNAPYCHHRPCRTAGVRCELVNGRTATGPETAEYRCPNGHGTRTLVGWAMYRGAYQGIEDVIDNPGLASYRRDRYFPTVGDEKATEVSRAYARMYVLSVDLTTAALDEVK